MPCMMHCSHTPVHNVCTLYRSDDLQAVEVKFISDKCLVMDLSEEMGYIFVTRLDITTEIK